MKLDQVANSGNDEFYTPEYAVQPILEFIPRIATVWCPFDTEDSHFVKMIRMKGANVIRSHIEDGSDFFSYFPKCGVDFIVSNPPYSVKGEVFERLFELDVPFAMLVGVVGLFESQKRFSMFKSNQFEIMYLNKRVSFYKDHAEQSPSLNPPFSSVYITSRMLPDRIMFREVEKTMRGG